MAEEQTGEAEGLPSESAEATEPVEVTPNEALDSFILARTGRAPAMKPKVFDCLPTGCNSDLSFVFWVCPVLVSIHFRHSQRRNLRLCGIDESRERAAPHLSAIPTPLQIIHHLFASRQP
jgi:hypothetical protein